MEKKQEFVDMSPKRRWYDAKWEEGQVVSMKIPNDTVIVGFHINIKGSFVATYTGTPTTRPEGLMDSILRYIEFIDDRQGQVKYLRPHFLHMQNLNALGIPARRLYSVGASANPFPTTEGAAQLGTTGQTVSVDESVYLPMEHVFSEPGMGREMTYFNTRRSTATNLKFHCGTMQQLLASVGGGVTFSAQNFQIQVQLVERADVPSNVVFDIWRQIQKSEPFTGQVSDKEIDLNMGAKLTGLAFYCIDGASGKAASNKLLKKIALVKNSRGAEQEVTFPQLQDANRTENTIISPWVAGTNRLDGYAHMNLIARRELQTALDTTRENGTNSLKLKVDTNDNSLVDYTGAANLFIVTEELVKAKV